MVTVKDIYGFRIPELTSVRSPGGIPCVFITSFDMSEVKVLDLDFDPIAAFVVFHKVLVVPLQRNTCS